MFRNIQAPPPPPLHWQQNRNKVKASAVIPVVILIGCVIGAAYFSGFFGELGGGILSPTRYIEGTWKTAIPAVFTIAIDYDDFVNLKDVGTENRMMTWKNHRHRRPTW